MRVSLPEILRPRYILSLPERSVRALAASLGGLLYEITQLALPGWVRGSRLYQSLVYRFLRLTIELIGDVDQVFPGEDIKAGELAIRKSIGNVLEFVGILTLGLSPLWVLAATSDLTGGTRAYLRAFVAELKADGLLEHSADIHGVEDLLVSLENSSRVMADLVDVPPLRIQDLKNSWESLQQNTSVLPGPSQLSGLYQLLQRTASQEGRSVGMVSSMIASGALRAGYRLGSVHIFDYYKEALQTVREDGWVHYVRRVGKPYSVIARSHFDPKRITLTERGLSRMRERR